MVSIINVLLISLVTELKITSGIQASSSSNVAISHLDGENSASGVGLALSNIQVSQNNHLRKEFSIGSRTLKVNFGESSGLSRCSQGQINELYGILNTGFQAKQIDFNRVQTFLSSAQIEFLSVQSQLFSLFRNAHLLNNQIKFDFKTWYGKQLKQQEIIKLVKKNKIISRLEYQLASKDKEKRVAQEIQGILSQFYQLKLESVKNVGFKNYLKQIQIQSLGISAYEIKSIFKKLQKKTQGCYKIIPKAQVIYLPVKDANELIFVGYSNDEATQIVQKNSFSDFLAMRVGSINLSNLRDLSALMLDIKSNYKSCGQCVQDASSLIDNAVSSIKSGNEIEVKENLLLNVGAKFSFDQDSKLSAKVATEYNLGTKINLSYDSEFTLESSTKININSKKSDTDTNSTTTSDKLAEVNTLDKINSVKASVANTVETIKPVKDSKASTVNAHKFVKTSDSNVITEPDAELNYRVKKEVTQNKTTEEKGNKIVTKKEVNKKENTTPKQVKDQNIFPSGNDGKHKPNPKDTSIFEKDIETIQNPLDRHDSRDQLNFNPLPSTDIITDVDGITIYNPSKNSNFEKNVETIQNSLSNPNTHIPLIPNSQPDKNGLPYDNDGLQKPNPLESPNFEKEVDNIQNATFNQNTHDPLIPNSQPDQNGLPYDNDGLPKPNPLDATNFKKDVERIQYTLNNQNNQNTQNPLSPNRQTDQDDLPYVNDGLQKHNPLDTSNYRDHVERIPNSLNNQNSRHPSDLYYPSSTDATTDSEAQFNPTNIDIR